MQGCSCKIAWYIKEDCYLKALFFFILYFLKSSYKTTKNGKILCLSNLIQSTSNLPFPFSNPLFDLLFLIFTINNQIVVKLMFLAFTLPPQAIDLWRLCQM